VKRAVLALSACIVLALGQPAHAQPAPSLIVQPGRTCATCAGLRLREWPSIHAPIKGTLPARTSVIGLARSVPEGWVNIRLAGGDSGWVIASAVTATLNTAQLTPIELRDLTAKAPVTRTRASPALAMSAVYLRGQRLGRQRNVFVRIGDSLSVATWVLYPFGWGRYNLRTYAALSPTVQLFSSGVVRAENTFSAIPVAADNGWTSTDVLDPARANASVCKTGESPLTCEIRSAQPAIALIQLGTNDVATLGLDTYRTNLEAIVNTLLDAGVIPVISTLPPRMQFEGPVADVNTVVRDIAARYELPLVDYGAAMRALPGYGLSADGVHPSAPPGDFYLTADFSDENLRYGYTLRNLLLLRMLDTLRQETIYAR
jgi:GDSL-like Lipase/Acylhydrolase family